MFECMHQNYYNQMEKRTSSFKSFRIKTEPKSKPSLPKLQKAPSTKRIFNGNSYEVKKILSSKANLVINPQRLLNTTKKDLNNSKRATTCTFNEDYLRSTKLVPSNIKARNEIQKSVGKKCEKDLFLEDDNNIHITAQKWLIHDCNKAEPIKGFKYKKSHDSASISKLLTFYTCYALIKEHKLSLSKVELLVLKQDEEMGGTVISLKEDSIVYIEDMLYALLLNSANNAATVLANNLGHLAKAKKQKRYFSCFDINSENRNSNMSYFVQLMNRHAEDLEMNETSISNPHGMSANLLSPRDIVAIFQTCLKIPLFCEIIQTQEKEIKLKSIDFSGKMQIAKVNLHNTNKILNSNHCQAGKTGENTKGGNSLVCFFKHPDTDRSFITVVLGSFGREQKYRDALKLYNWATTNVSD